MYIVRRALRRIIRLYKRSILLLLAMVLLFTFYGGSWVLDIAAANLETDIKEKIGAYITVSQGAATIDSPLRTFSTMRSLAKALAADYPIQYYDLSLYETVTFKGNQEEPIILKGVEESGGMLFYEEIISLVSGKALSNNMDTHCAIVSERLARANELTIGDSLELEFWLLDPVEQLSNHVFSIKIVGLFKVKPDARRERIEPDYMKNREREIYVRNDFVYEHAIFRQSVLQYEDETAVSGHKIPYEQWMDNQSGLNQYQIEGRLNCSALTFRLQTVKVVDSFTQRLQSLIGYEEEMAVSTEKYQRMALGIISLQNLAKTVKVITLVAILAGIPLVLWLTLRDRKKEFAILRAIGASKNNVYLQVIFETISITIVAISLSLVGSLYLSQHYSQICLQSVKDPSPQERYFGIESVDTLEIGDIVSSYKIVFPTKMIVALYGIGFAISLSGALVPVMFFMASKLRRLLL